MENNQVYADPMFQTYSAMQGNPGFQPPPAYETIPMGQQYQTAPNVQLTPTRQAPQPQAEPEPCAICMGELETDLEKKKWRYRYFVLFDDRLLVYKSQEDAQMGGEVINIPLSEIYSAYTTTKSKKHPYCIAILLMHKKRKVYISCVDVQQMETWRVNLQKKIYDVKGCTLDIPVEAVEFVKGKVVEINQKKKERKRRRIMEELWLNQEQDPNMLSAIENILFEKCSEEPVGLESILKDSGRDIVNSLISCVEEDMSKRAISFSREIKEEKSTVSTTDSCYLLGRYNPNNLEPSELEIFSEKMLSLANAYVEKGSSPEKARIAFEQALVINPYLGQAWYNLGNFFLATGQVEDALRCFMQTTYLYPKYIPAYSDQSAIYINDGNFSKALELLNKAIDLDPSNSVLYYNAAICYRQLKYIHEAIDYYGKAYELDKKNINAFYAKVEGLTTLGKWEECEKILDEFNEENSSEYALVCLGCICLQLGKHEKAIENFEYALLSNPNCTDAIVNLGLAQLAKGDYPKASENIKKAIISVPNNAKLHNSLANALRMTGEIESAISHYEEAIKLDPNFVEAYASLGILYQTVGMEEECRPILLKALELDPENSEISFAVAKMYENMDNEEQATFHYDKAYNLFIRKLPTSIRSTLNFTNEEEIFLSISKLLNDPQMDLDLTLKLYSNVAMYLKELRQYDRAIYIYASLVRIDSNNYPLNYNLANLYKTIGRHEEALSVYTKLSHHDNAEFDATLCLCELLILQKKYERVVPLLVNVTKNQTNSIKGWSLLADTYFDLEDFGNAQQAYNHVHRLKPNEPEPLLAIGMCFYHLKRYADSISIYEQAISIDQDYYMSYFNLGIIKSELNRLQESIKDLEMCISLAPDFAPAYLALGTVLFKIKDKRDQGIFHLQKAVDMDSSLYAEVPEEAQKVLVIRE